MKKMISKYNSFFKKLSGKETLYIWLGAFFMVAWVSYIFYDSWVAFICLLPSSLVLAVFLVKEKISKKHNDISIHFAEALNCVSSSLKAGYSMENAFLESYKEMVVLYGEDAYITELLREIVNAINVNISLSDTLQKIGEESDVTDIKTFAEVYKFARRSGGDMVAIIRKTSDNIYEKQTVKKEIDVLISSKKLEQKIMCFIPFVIIIYLKVSMPGMLSPLYHNPLGCFIMTCVLVMYVFSVMLGRRIVRIEV